MIGEHVDIDDLVDVGNALGLGDRRRIDGMAGGPRLLAVNVDTQICGERRVVGGMTGTIHGGRAVNHGAGRARDLLGSALEGETRIGARIGVAVGI